MTPVNLIGLVQEKYHNKQAIRVSNYYILLINNMNNSESHSQCDIKGLE